MLPSDNERELIERARTEPEAFAVLYDRYYPLILNYAARRLGSIELAQDVVANVFLKAFSRLWQFRWRSIPFSAWLYRMAGNEIASYYRRKRIVTVPLEDADGEIAAADNPPDAELIQQQEELERHREFVRVRAAVERLPERYREAIALRFFEGKMVLEIALILGKKEGTVKSLLSRGIGQLRGYMAETQPKPGGGVIDNESRKSKPLLFTRPETYED